MTKGLAGVKFSGSFSKFGENKTILASRIKRMIKPVRSFVEKYV